MEMPVAWAAPWTPEKEHALPEDAAPMPKMVAQTAYAQPPKLKAAR
jgi:hypothetical protein